MRKYRKIAVDTSVFINPDSLRIFGQNPKESFTKFLEKSRERAISIYMPPSIFEELLNFLDKDSISDELLSSVIKKPPKKYEIFIPSLFLYEFTEEMRLRINKGLRIAEKYTRYGISGRKPEEELIKSLRDEYRVALREGIIDSRQDIDLLALAKEIESPVLSSDQGLIKWAEKLGIEALTLEEVKTVLYKKQDK